MSSNILSNLDWVWLLQNLQANPLSFTISPFYQERSTKSGLSQAFSPTASYQTLVSSCNCLPWKFMVHNVIYKGLLKPEASDRQSLNKSYSSWVWNLLLIDSTPSCNPCWLPAQRPLAMDASRLFFLHSMTKRMSTVNLAWSQQLSFYPTQQSTWGRATMQKWWRRGPSYWYLDSHDRTLG